MTTSLEFSYHLFLRNPVTQECKVQEITVTAHEGEVLDANLLFQKLADNPEQFDPGFTLIGLNVGLVSEVPDPQSREIS